MNFFNQGIPLGRWFRITVIVHWTFLLYAANELMHAGDAGVGLAALGMGLLFGVVLLHEFGHALSCRAVGGEADHIVLWPLGGLAFVRPPMNPFACFITTACGPLVNAVLWPTAYFLARALVIHQHGPVVWDVVAELAAQDPSAGLFLNVSWPARICLFLWQINKLLLLFNLIPAYPMDGGRLLQEILWMALGYGRSLMIAGMVGTVAGVSFIVIGLGLRPIEIRQLGFSLGTRGEVEPMLVLIGFLAAVNSFGIYRKSQEIHDYRKR
jgi:Zn-dependent protease